MKTVLSKEQISVLNLTLKDAEYYEVSIRPVKDLRSTKSNNFYWGVVIPKAQEGLSALISDESGIKQVTKDVAHYYLKNQFLKEYNPELGIDVIGQTSKLNTEEFAKYTDRCMDFIIEKLGESFSEEEIRSR